MLDKQGLEIKELSAQLNKEKSKTKALHQIIISSGQPASYLPRDEDIREVFQQLSVLIQNTIHKYATVDVSKGSERWWHKGNDDHRFAYREKIFTKSYNEFDGETKRLWLRAWVALILNRELLGIPRFGAEMQLDEGLSRIERDFKDSAKGSSIVNIPVWRGSNMV
jgi:hypothetical protein